MLPFPFTVSDGVVDAIAEVATSASCSEKKSELMQLI